MIVSKKSGEEILDESIDDLRMSRHVLINFRYG